MEAADSIGKPINGDISRCANGGVATAGGFFWKKDKVDYIDVTKYKIVKTPYGARVYDMSLEGKARRRAGHGKAVNQYTLDGKYITTYNSVSDAGDAIGGCRSGIGKCCKKKDPKYKTAGGFLWEYDTGDNRCDKIAV